MLADDEEEVLAYFEALPDQCPPVTAVDAHHHPVWRVVSCANPTMEDFYSHAKNGRTKPDPVGECEWASCSLFDTAAKATSIASKLPKPRFANPYLSELQIAVGSGKSLKKKGHVHFWMYAGFDPMQSIIQTTPI